MDELILFDEEFEPDADADSELPGAPVPTLSDAEIAGCRLVLRQLDFETQPYGTGIATATAFVVHFHCGIGAWFSHAQIEMIFRKPTHARVLSIHPTKAESESPRRIDLLLAGEAGIEFAPVYAGAIAERRVSYEVRPEIERATGIGTSRVLWTFRTPSDEEPLPETASLALVIDGEGPFEVEIEASARIVRKGIAGQVARIRDLMIGSNMERVAKRRFSFPLVQPPGEQRLFARFRPGNS